jgi:hypothetical protein
MALGRFAQLLQAYIRLDLLRAACELILTSAGAATGHAKSSARALAAAVISDRPVRIAVSTFLLIEADPVSSSQQKLRESC